MTSLISSTSLRIDAPFTPRHIAPPHPPILFSGRGRSRSTQSTAGRPLDAQPAAVTLRVRTELNPAAAVAHNCERHARHCLTQPTTVPGGTRVLLSKNPIVSAARTRDAAASDARYEAPSEIARLRNLAAHMHDHHRRRLPRSGSCACAPRGAGVTGLVRGEEKAQEEVQGSPCSL